MPIEDVFTTVKYGIMATGQIESGVIKVGETIELVGLHNTQKFTVVGIEMSSEQFDQAQAGDNAGIIFGNIDKDALERGQVIAQPGSATAHREFEAEVYLLTKEEGGRQESFVSGDQSQFYIRTADITGEIQLAEGLAMIAPGDNAKIKVKLIAPVALNEGLRFAIREGGHTIGVGTVTTVID
jgi:elongation factor Tu